MTGLRITDVRAYPTSFPVDPKDSVTLGIGRTVKRDAVIVKVSTAEGVTGWGEAHHGRCPGAVAHLVNTTMKQLVVGQDEVRYRTGRSEEHTSELQSPDHLVCRLLLEKKNK